jgi:hypothetical protein
LVLLEADPLVLPGCAVPVEDPSPLWLVDGALVALPLADPLVEPLADPLAPVEEPSGLRLVPVDDPSPWLFIAPLPLAEPLAAPLLLMDDWFCSMTVVSLADPLPFAPLPPPPPLVAVPVAEQPTSAPKNAAAIAVAIGFLSSMNRSLKKTTIGTTARVQAGFGDKLLSEQGANRRHRPLL